MAKEGLSDEERAKLAEHNQRLIDEITPQLEALAAEARELMRKEALAEREKEEVERLRAELLKTYCAYCGKEYPLDNAAAEKVSEHIRTCEKHPMRRTEAERDALRREVERLRADPFRVSRCNACGATIMPGEDCRVCYHRETLRALIHKGGLCTDLHCEEVLREREPWLFESPPRFLAGY